MTFSFAIETPISLWGDIIDVASATFDNGVNNHQNNLRISAGVVVHFGRR